MSFIRIIDHAVGRTFVFAASSLDRQLPMLFPSPPAEARDAVDRLADLLTEPLWGAEADGLCNYLNLSCQRIADLEDDLDALDAVLEELRATAL